MKLNKNSVARQLYKSELINRLLTGQFDSERIYRNVVKSIK